MKILSNYSKVLNKIIKEEKVITQADLANQMNVSSVAINKWLKGGAISVDKIPKLCSILNITPNELFGFYTSEDRIFADKLYYHLKLILYYYLIYFEYWL